MFKTCELVHRKGCLIQSRKYSCRIKLVDPNKFLSAKVDFRLNAIFAFKRCSLGLAGMDCVL